MARNRIPHAPRALKAAACVAAALLCAAAPASASVIYDFVTTSASGFTAGGRLPFTDPDLTLTVGDAAYQAGAYHYAAGLAGFCFVPQLCQHQGDPLGIDISSWGESWTPLYGTAFINLAFSPETATGRIVELGLSLDLALNGSGGAIQSDLLNCAPHFCGFTGYWRRAADPIPEPPGLLVLAMGLLGLGLYRMRCRLS